MNCSRHILKNGTRKPVGDGSFFSSGAFLNFQNPGKRECFFGLQSSKRHAKFAKRSANLRSADPLKLHEVPSFQRPKRNSSKMMIINVLNFGKYLRNKKYNRRKELIIKMNKVIGHNGELFHDEMLI